MKELEALYNITPFSMLDFPEKLSAIFWFTGCNMRCAYCHNVEIVLAKPIITESKAISFLKSRIGLLEGVVLSGGEPTLYKNIVTFAKKIKELGFLLKLDTNGLKPKVIKTLIKKSLIDYVALDYKAPKNKFKKITKNSSFDKFSKTVDILVKSGIDYEIRTTIHSELLNEEDIEKIIKDLQQRGFNKTFYIQNYSDIENSFEKLSPQKERVDIKRFNYPFVKFRNF